MITDEKRAFKRANHEFVINYKTKEKDPPKKGIAVSGNISLGGVYFMSIDRFSIGELIECEIDVPRAVNKNKWAARVVRCEKIKGKIINTFGVAVEFIKVFGNSEKNLKEILTA